MAKLVEPIVGTGDETTVLFTRDHQRLIDQLTAYYQLATVKKLQLMERFNYTVVDMHIFPFLPTTKRKLYALGARIKKTTVQRKRLIFQIFYP